MQEIIEWDVMSTLIYKHFSIRFTKKHGKPDFFGGDGKPWIKKIDYEDLENIEIIKCLEELRPFKGDLYIIADASYRKELGPFKIKSFDIYDFANNFCESFVNTDLMIFNFEIKLIWIFHHSGFYTVVEQLKREQINLS